MERSRYKFANSNLPHFMTCTAYFPEGIALDSDFHPSGNSHNTIGVSTFIRSHAGEGNEEARKTDRSYQFWQEGRAYQSLFFHKPRGEYLPA